MSNMSRIFTTSFASIYPLYVAKVQKKGRTNDELDRVIHWLTGFDKSALSRHLAEGTTFEKFFAEAQLNPRASLITGVVCGVRVHCAALHCERRESGIGGVQSRRTPELLLTHLQRRDQELGVVGPLVPLRLSHTSR